MDANSPPQTQFGLVVERTFRSEQFNGGVERGGDGERRGVELFAYVEWLVDCNLISVHVLVAGAAFCPGATNEQPSTAT